MLLSRRKAIQVEQSRNSKCEGSEVCVCACFGKSKEASVGRTEPVRGREVGNGVGEVLCVLGVTLLFVRHCWCLGFYAE